MARFELRDYEGKNILKFHSPQEKYEKLDLFGQFAMKGPKSEGKEDCSMQVSQLSFVGVIFGLHWKFQKEKDFFFPLVSLS